MNRRGGSLGIVGSQAGAWEPEAEVRESPMKHLLVFLLALVLTSTALAEDKLTSLAVYPPDISLNTKADSQRFIVVATRDDGVTLDVTDQAKLQLADPMLCRLEKSVLYPAADGETKLEVEYQGLKSVA